MEVEVTKEFNLHLKKVRFFHGRKDLSWLLLHTETLKPVGYAEGEFILTDSDEKLCSSFCIGCHVFLFDAPLVKLHDDIYEVAA